MFKKLIQLLGLGRLREPKFKKMVTVVYSLETGGAFTTPRYIILDCEDAKYVCSIIVGTRLGIDAVGAPLTHEVLDGYSLVHAEPLGYALKEEPFPRGGYSPPDQMTLIEFERMLEDYK